MPAKLDIVHIDCPHCHAQFPTTREEPWADCPDCDSSIQNPHFRFLDGNPEIELM